MLRQALLASVLIFVIFAQPAASQSTAVPDSQRWFVRVGREHMHDARVAEHVDTCALDPEGAVLLLTQNEIDALQVPATILSSEADHVRAFYPRKTMETVGVPSIARLLGEPLPEPPQGGIAGDTVHLEYDRYHSPQEGIDFFTNLASAYADIATLEVIGQSIEQRDIIALRISSNPGKAEPQKQRIVFCALHHAREWATHEMILYLAEYLTTRYESDLRVQNIVNNSVVWVVLSVNPDGFQYSWDEDRFWRKNRRLNLVEDDGDEIYGIDLNRNYDYNWGPGFGGSSSSPYSETYHGTAPASEPETQAMQNLVAEEKPAIAITYHTYSQLVLYPWGYTDDVTPESYTALRAVADKYASLVDSAYGFTYYPGPINYTLYTTNGDFTDYAYGAHGCLAYTPELRPSSTQLGGFELPEDQILPNNLENMKAALWLMDNVANARMSASPPVGWFGPGTNRFSIPLAPVNQQPELSLGMDAPVAALLQAHLDDADHVPPVLGFYPVDFEAVSAGSEYRLAFDDDTASWAENFAGYEVLPHLFEDGAVVMLENFAANSQVHIGSPSEQPVAMTDISIYKRRLQSTENNFGYFEDILEERSAVEDLSSDNPWISWTWQYAHADGTNEFSHPLGENGADTFVHPYASYGFLNHNASYNFDSFFPGNAVYLLRFPPPLRGDADEDSDVDLLDWSVLAGCLTGPVQEVLSGDCAMLDVDHDFDVDAADVGVLFDHFTGDR